jgi:hypothetical protein
MFRHPGTIFLEIRILAKRKEFLHVLLLCITTCICWKCVDYVLLCRIVLFQHSCMFSLLLDHNVQFLWYHEHFTWLWTWYV